MFLKQTRQQIRIFTDTEEPHNTNFVMKMDSDSEDSESEISDYLRENPLLSNPRMPIFDIATGKLDEPTVNNQPPFIWLMDRSDRLGASLPLGKKNVAITTADDQIVVGKPWGNEVVPYDKDKQQETILQLARAYNLAVGDLRSMDRKLKGLEMNKRLTQDFILNLEMEIEDNFLADTMFCFQEMCSRMEKPLMAKSKEFSHTISKANLFQKIAGLKVQIQELEQLLQQTSENSTPDQSQGSPPASQSRSPASGRAQRSRHRDASRVPRVRSPDSKRVHPEQTPDSTRGPGGQRPDSPELYPYSHHQALSMRKVLPVRRPVPPMPGLVSDDSDDPDDDVEPADDANDRSSCKEDSTRDDSVRESGDNHLVTQAEMENFPMPPMASAIHKLIPPAKWLQPHVAISLSDADNASNNFTSLSLGISHAMGLKSSPITLSYIDDSLFVDAATTEAKHIQGRLRQ
jgi:hypothetical protein